MDGGLCIAGCDKNKPGAIIGMLFANVPAIYIDAGRRDEYFLDLGAEAFRRALEEIGVTDVFFELFDAKHGSIGYRYPVSLKYLAERLS